MLYFPLDYTGVYMAFKKHQLKQTLAILVALIALTACISKPELKTVSDGATEQSINTPEQIKELQQKYAR